MDAWRQRLRDRSEGTALSDQVFVLTKGTCCSFQAPRRLGTNGDSEGHLWQEMIPKSGSSRSSTICCT
ncbi:Spermidine/putrescine import ATP-binding protein PotA [Dissostichus eleginoides]|uniref:Spermidine/putrescine import ATP-binding protein PotA n=1 Tax=Dissostichus eleginoides TaxID=100907 RepID=A0AAD9FDM0_DISEL|nr:Spermidine/putrescine import ATP-binding protein PotA [Dissostichus eleginoides]